MSKFEIKEIAREETIKVFPEYEVTNPSYIEGIAINVTNKFIYLYGRNIKETISRIRELLLFLLRDLRKSMNLKLT